jgi:hypothetical protein
MTVIAKTRQTDCPGTELVADRLGLKSAYSETVAHDVAERLGVEEGEGKGKGEEDTVLRYVEGSPSLFERHQISEIAELISSLTYGETVQLASELRKAPVETKQLDKMAELIRSLTYGEMIDLAAGLLKAADGEITGEAFPAILHRWASEHRNRPETPGTELLTLDWQLSSS